LSLERQLQEVGAGWILIGLPALASLIPGKVSAASVQWATDGAGWRIGDALWARDTLSSQGLAAGISEALYCAAAVRASGDADPMVPSAKASKERSIFDLWNN